VSARSGVIICFVWAAVFCGSSSLDARAARRAFERRLPNPDEPVVRVGFARPGGGYTIESLPLEAYVARVLAGEAVRDSRPAALDALAITLRTFALANLGRHRADGFDLCDQTHCQVVRSATKTTEQAAHATAGRILLHDHRPASVYYSASCGGRTEIPSRVWPGAEDPSFLPSKPDDACGRAPAWTALLDAADLQRALHAAGFRGGRLRGLTIADRNPSGRVARLHVDGLTPDTISGQDLRVAVGRTLGWQHVKSTAFELRREGPSYRFSGHGSGHGVGLCVIGSARLAEAGADAESILRRYFPGLAIAPLDARSTADVRAGPRTEPTPEVPRSTLVRSDVVVSLPDGDDGERAAIVRATSRARDDLARRLGIAPPPQIIVRFHATTDDYERATGEAWFTSGALVRGEVHLLPPGVLRERGVLDRTIRHELVHVMTDAVLGARPAWVREGAAIYFAGDPPIPGAVVQRPAFRPEPSASCPTDAELLRPVSVGALSNAYARARVCFARQVDGGKKWADVK
jgi:stage II sporulation protein D (peptidoglycan lytic transglycosylase)